MLFDVFPNYDQDNVKKMDADSIRKVFGHLGSGSVMPGSRSGYLVNEWLDTAQVGEFTFIPCVYLYIVRSE